MTLFSWFFPEQNKSTIRDFLSCREIRLIKALRTPSSPTVYPKVEIGACQTLLRTPLVDNERLPKDTAGRGLTSTLWLRIFEEEEPQLEDKSGHDLRRSQARPTVGDIGISQAGSGLGP